MSKHWDGFLSYCILTSAVPLRNNWLPYYTHEHVQEKTCVLWLPLLLLAVKNPLCLPIYLSHAARAAGTQTPAISQDPTGSRTEGDSMSKLPGSKNNDIMPA